MTKSDAMREVARLGAVCAELKRDAEGTLLAAWQQESVAGSESVALSVRSCLVAYQEAKQARIALCREHGISFLSRG
jgi:hypothetical protein